MKVREAVITRIVELCEKKDMTFNALANEAGLSPSTLKNIINGNSCNPGICTIKIICDGLNITIKEFFHSDLFDKLEQEIY